MPYPQPVISARSARPYALVAVFHGEPDGSPSQLVLWRSPVPDRLVTAFRRSFRPSSRLHDRVEIRRGDAVHEVLWTRSGTEQVVVNGFETSRPIDWSLPYRLVVQRDGLPDLIVSEGHNPGLVLEVVKKITLSASGFISRVELRDGCGVLETVWSRSWLRSV